jgi:hypothetical protein
MLHGGAPGPQMRRFSGGVVHVNSFGSAGRQSVFLSGSWGVARDTMSLVRKSHSCNRPGQLRSSASSVTVRLAHGSLRAPRLPAPIARPGCRIRRSSSLRAPQLLRTSFHGSRTFYLPKDRRLMSRALPHPQRIIVIRASGCIPRPTSTTDGLKRSEIDVVRSSSAPTPITPNASFARSQLHRASQPSRGSTNQRRRPPIH